MAQKTTLSLMGIPGGMYGSFAGKTSITPPPVVVVAVGIMVAVAVLQQAPIMPLAAVAVVVVHTLTQQDW